MSNDELLHRISMLEGDFTVLQNLVKSLEHTLNISIRRIDTLDNTVRVLSEQLSDKSDSE